MVYFIVDLLRFLAKMSTFAFSMAYLALLIKSKHFTEFLQIPNFLRSEVLSRSATCEATRAFTFC